MGMYHTLKLVATKIVGVTPININVAGIHVHFTCVYHLADPHISIDLTDNFRRGLY